MTGDCFPAATASDGFRCSMGDKVERHQDQDKKDTDFYTDALIFGLMVGMFTVMG